MARKPAPCARSPMQPTVPGMPGHARAAYQALKRAMHADQGQNPKPAALRVRKPKAAIKPTWPRTKDQKAQQRPLIVLHPARQMAAGMSEKRKDAFRAAFNAMPKHECDASVLRGWL